MNAVPILYRWLALAAAMGLSALFGAMQMHEHDTRVNAAFVAAVKAEGQKQVEHTGAVIATQKGITDETVNAYSNSLASLRQYYADKLRTSASRGNMPAVSSTAQATHAAAADSVSVAHIVETLIPPKPTLEQQCAETTLMLVSLQSWVDKQTKVK